MKLKRCGLWLVFIAFSMAGSRIEAGNESQPRSNSSLADLNVHPEKKMWVDRTWNGRAAGLEIETGKVFGRNAFATVQEAIDAAAPSGTVIISPGHYTDIRANKSLTLIGTGPGVVIHGASPAFIASSGTVTVNGATFVTSTADPTVLVTGGTLIMRGCSVSESDSNNESAISITGGTLDAGTVASPGNNTINVRGPGQAISNTGANPVSAIGNTWQQDGTNLTSNFAIEDHIFHAIDAGGGGLVTWVTNNAYVTLNSGSIQRAINVVPAGYIVNLDAITYTEGPQIVVSNQVTVTGASLATTTVQPTGNTSNSGDAKGWWLVEPGTAFNLQNLTLNGAGKLVFQAIRSYGLITIDNVRFTQIQYNPSGPDYAGTAVVGFDNGVTAASLTVSNCQFDAIGRIGAFFFGNTTGTFVNSTYTGKGAGNWLDYGVELGAGAVATISSSTITGNTGVASVDSSTSAGATADTFFGPGTKVTVKGNHINGNTDGIVIGVDDPDTTVALLENNDLTGNGNSGFSVVGGAIIDAGDCSGGNVTGLGTGSGSNGSSAGGNNLSGYGFDNVAPWAIQDFNTSTEAVVLAQQDNFGATVGQDIGQLVYDNGDSPTLSAVIFSQSGALLISCPANTNLQCIADVPSGAVTLAQFVAQGGVVSSSSGTVSFVDAFVPGAYPNDGTITRTYTVASVCGQTNTCSQTIVVDDTIAPVISTCASNQTLSVGINCQVAVPDLRGQIVALDNCAGSLTFNQSPIPGTPVGLGSTIVTLSVDDGRGNTNTCTATLTIVDTTPPVISLCASNRTLSADSGCQLSLPDLRGEVVATDNCGGTLNYLQAPTQGTLIGLGDTTVTVFVDDGRGNTNNCTATVTVVDTTPPTVVCTNITRTLNSNDTSVVIVPADVFNATASSDNCGTVTPVSVNPNTFVCGGSYSVTLVAADGHGNTNSCVAVVTVVDNRPAPSLVYVDAGYTNVANGTAVGWPYGNMTLNHLVGCDAFATIQGGVNRVANNGTVNVAAGGYVENVAVTKPLALSGSGQGVSIVYPATSNPNCGGAGGSSLCPGGSNIILVQANDVVISGFTLDGDNTNLTSGIVTDGADLDARNGIIVDFNAGVFNNLVVHDVTVKNIYLRGIYAGSGGTFDFHSNTVYNVQADASSVAIFNFGGSGVIASNLVSDASDAISANWSTGTLFLNNTITNSASGVHTDNNGGDGGSPDLLKGNVVINGTPGAYGVWVFAPYTNTVVEGNVISNVDVALLEAGQQATTTILFTNNTAIGNMSTNGAGVYVTSSLFGFGSSDVSAIFVGNIITNFTPGLFLEAETGFALQVQAFDNSISGNALGAQTNDLGGSFSIDASGNWWGVNTTAGVAALISGPIDYTPWLDTGTDTSPAEGFQGDFSHLHVSSASPQSGATGRIQEADSLLADGALISSNRIVEVHVGTYPEAVTIDKPLMLLGAQSGQNANTRFAAFTVGANGPKADPSVESVITAAADAPASAPNDTVHVMADNVTVDGFVVDGNNPALAQGGAVVVGGINTDSRRAIETEDVSGNFFSVNGALIQNNIIQNFAARGIELVNPTDTSPPTSGSLIAGNVVRNFGSDGILLAFNAYSDVISNTVDMASGGEAGIWLQDFPNSGALPQTLDWSHNTVTACQDAFGGIWVNLFYASAATINIHDNTVNAAVGVTGTDDFTYGIYLTSLQDGTTANLANNIVGTSGGQFARGIALWNLPTTATTTVTGGTISNALKGISLQYDDPNFGDAGASFAANLSAVTISGANVGVLVDATDSGSLTVQMQISSNTSISACTTGISVLSTNASGNIHDNIASITGNTVGVDVDAGKALLQNNNLTGNSEAGIRVEDGAIVDAGNCGGVNVTGLGISTGGNNLSGYGFDNAAPWAVEDLNSSSQASVLAQQDNFGATFGQDIEQLLYDQQDLATLSTVIFSQSGALVVSCPPPTNVQCQVDVPAGAVTLAQFVAQGGVVSSSSGTVSFVDAFVPGAYPNDGTYTRTYTVASVCGQTNTCSQTIVVDDTIAPVISTCASNQTLSVGINCQVAVPDLRGQVVALDNCAGSLTINQIPTAGTMVGLGTTIVTLSVDDGRGNTNACAATLTIVDTTPPVISLCASNRTLSADSGCQLSLPDLRGEVVATDNCGGTLNYLQAPTPGTLVGLGATTVTVFVDDGRGNTNNCIATVTVVDTTPPTVVCTNITRTLNSNDTSVVIAPADVFNATASSDNCGTVTPVSVNPNTFVCGGSYSVTLVAADGHGNTNSCVATVTVVDNRPAPSLVYVDAGYTNVANGTAVGWPYGNMTLNHLVGCDAFATIQGGVNRVISNGTVNIATGTYPENVTVPNPITLLGANAGVDPRLSCATGPARAPESIIDGNGIEAAVLFQSSGVTLDGFTIRDGASGTYNAGVHMGGGYQNNLVINNIITNNSIGVFADCAGPLPSVVQRNLFTGNNLCPDCAAGGAGLYVDGSVNLQVIENEFIGHTNNNAVLIAAEGADSNTNLLFTGNNVHDNNAGSAVYVLGVTSGTFTSNRVSAVGLFTGLRFGSADSGVDVENNLFTNCVAGVRLIDDGYSYPANNSIVIHGNSFVGMVSNTVSFDLGGDSDPVLDASGNWWGDNTPAGVSAMIGTNGGPVDYTPWLDAGTDTSSNTCDGFQGDFSHLHVSADSPQSGSTSRIQEADELLADGSLVNSNRIVQVHVGAYAEDLTIDKPLQLLGPNANINPNTQIRGTEAVVYPATSDPDPSIDEIVIYITTNNVTINGLTVNGDNPSLTSGIVLRGADLDAAIAIASFEGVGSITVVNDIITNTSYSGVEFYNFNNGAIATADNHIQDNKFDNIGYVPYGFGVGVLIYNNFYADVSDNVMTDVRLGVQTGNFTAANPGTTQDINNNIISCTQLGVFHNLAYLGASAFTISNNVISFLYEPDSSEWDGIEISSIEGSVGATIVNNTITGATTNDITVGYNVWSCPTSLGITIGGGSVSNVNYGAWLNNWDGYSSPGDSTKLTIDVLDIVDASTAGVYVQDDPRAANGSVLLATVTSNTVINASGLGVFVQGPNAAATVINNVASIVDNQVGIQVDGGKALVENNNLSGNAVAGILATNGAVVDAGDCSDSDVTGLGTGSGPNGSSAGNNNLSGYSFDNAAPWAVEDLNSSAQPVVLAQLDNYGAGVGQDINQLLYDVADNNSLSEVIFSQAGPLDLSCPPGINVQCQANVPVGATTLAQFLAQGGVVSCSSGTVSFVDSFAPGAYPNDGTITRTYTVATSCGQTNSCNQTIVVDDTIAPVISICASNQTLSVGADCEVAVPNLIGQIMASDNCAGTLNITQNPIGGTPVGVGVTTVTLTVDDGRGNTNTCVATLTIVDTTPPVINCPSTVTVSTDAGLCTASDVNLGTPSVSDNCGVASVTSNAPFSYPLGTNFVVWVVTDIHSNSASCTQQVIVVDTTPPTLTCPPNVLLNIDQPRDPYATGTPGTNDNCGAVTLSYNDNRGGLTNCNVTGVILRTWTAIDGSGNTNTCVQSITIIDTNAPVLTACPADAVTNNDPGQCSAVVTYTPPTAVDVDYVQGFENPAWVSGDYLNNPSTDWNDFNSHVSRVPSGTDGIVSSSGAAHAIIVSTNAPDGQTGAFSRLGGYSGVFGSGWRAAVDVYINLGDPSVVTATPSTGYGWDLSMAASAQDGSFLRDFIFHTAAYDSNGVVVAASNDSSDSVRENDLLSLDHYTITNSDWYTFEWQARATNGVLAVDLNVRNSSGSLLWTETLSDTNDVIASVVGGNRYLWFTFLAVDQLAIDNTILERNVSVVSVQPSGSAFPVGTNTVTSTATDACGNSTNCTFTVIVNDTEAPVINCPAPVTVSTDPGLCSASNVALGAISATDNCAVASITNDAPVSFPIGTNLVGWIVTDIHGNSATCTQQVIVVDTEPPMIVCTPLTFQCASEVLPPVNTAGVVINTNGVAASDNCGPVTLTWLSDLTNSLGCANHFTIQRSYEATDSAGNTNGCTQTLTVHDTTPPTAICTNITVNLNGSGLVTITAAQVDGGSFDNCGGVVTLAINRTLFGCGDIGPNLVTLTVTDSCGNTNTCTATVTVRDVTPPSISGPANLTVNADAGLCSASHVALGTPTTSDNCAIASVSSNAPAIFPVGTNFVAWTAVDPSGNSASSTQRVIVVDNQPPVVVCQNLTLDLTNNIVTITAAQIDNGSHDNCGISSLTLDRSSFSCVDVGTNLVTLTAVDIHNNTNSCTATVVVLDVTPPTLTCPPNVVLNIDQARDPYATGTPGTNDNCGFVNLSYDDNRNGLTNCNTTGVILRTWTATDRSGNTNVCVQTITIIDTNAPVLTACPANIVTNNDTGLCSTVVTYTPPTAVDVDYVQGFENPSWVSGDYVAEPSTDWNDSNSTVQRVPSGTDGIISRSGVAHAVIDSTSPPDGTSGAFSRLGGYSSVFGTGWRTAVDVYINLADPAVATATPTTGYAWDLTGAASQQDGSFLRDFFFHMAAYNSNGVVVAADNNTNFARRNDLLSLDHYTITNSDWYTFEWQARSTNGVLAVDLNLRNSSGSLLWTETLSDTNDVIASVVGGNRYLWFTFLAVNKLAIDNTTLERNVPVVSVPPSGSAFPVGTNTVTSTATDACGNSTNCTFTVIVNDTEAPMIGCTPLNLQCASEVPLPVNTTGMALNTNGVMASDNCGPVTLTWLGDLTNSLGCANHFTIQRSYKATDHAGNTNGCTQTITVHDTTPPTAICTNITVNLNANGLVFLTAAQVDGGSFDNCGGPVTLSIDRTLFGCGDIGPNEVTLMVTDACGNTNSCTATVTIRDATPPSITAPANLTVNADAGQCSAHVSLGTPTASDNCGVASVINNAPAAIPVGTNFVVWTAFDPSGNSASSTQRVIVVDNQPPLISCTDMTVPIPVGLTCACDVSLISPLVSDNCGLASVTNNGMNCYALGTNLVVWTATDIHGNSSSCTQQVIVTQVAVNSGNISITEIQAIGNDIDLTWQTFGNSTNIIQLAVPTVDGSFTNVFTDIGSLFVPGSGPIITNWTDFGGATNFPSRYYRIHFQLGSPCGP